MNIKRLSNKQAGSIEIIIIAIVVVAVVSTFVFIRVNSTSNKSSTPISSTGSSQESNEACTFKSPFEINGKSADRITKYIDFEELSLDDVGNYTQVANRSRIQGKSCYYEGDDFGYEGYLETLPAYASYDSDDWFNVTLDVYKLDKYTYRYGDDDISYSKIAKTILPEDENGPDWKPVQLLNLEGVYILPSRKLLIIPDSQNNLLYELNAPNFTTKEGCVESCQEGIIDIVRDGKLQ